MDGQKKSSVGPRAAEIRNMFAAIASSYDRANTVLSLGIHHRWRSQLVKKSAAKTGDCVLDCATGTGDLAIAFKKHVGPTGVVIGSDFCAEMLETAPAKSQAEHLEIKFEVADVMALPHPSNTFDIVSIAFGIRNVENPRLGLAEMYRVLKPGGRLAVLEFGQPKIPVFKDLYRFYSDIVLPRVGGWVTGKPDAYSYLEKSSAKFPCRDEFLALVHESAPFKSSRYHSLTGGIAYLYFAEK